MGDEAQNATLDTVLQQLWGEQRCGVAMPAMPDVDIGPTSIHKWAATQLSKAGIGVALDDPHAAATTAEHSTVQLWMSESDLKVFVGTDLVDTMQCCQPENEKIYMIYGFTVVLERSSRYILCEQMVRHAGDPCTPWY